METILADTSFRFIIGRMQPKNKPSTFDYALCL